MTPEQAERRLRDVAELQIPRFKELADTLSQLGLVRFAGQIKALVDVQVDCISNIDASRAKEKA